MDDTKGMSMSNKKTGFSLSAFDTVARCEKGDTLHLLHPDTGLPCYNGDKDDGGIPVTISMYGTDSKVCLNMLQESIRRNAKAEKVAKGKNKSTDETFDIFEKIEDTADRLAKLIFEWTGFEGEDGNPLPCTFDNIKGVMLKFKEIRKQSSDFLDNADGVNFTKG